MSRLEGDKKVFPEKWVHYHDGTIDEWGDLEAFVTVYDHDIIMEMVQNTEGCRLITASYDPPKPTLRESINREWNW